MKRCESVVIVTHAEIQYKVLNWSEDCKPLETLEITWM